MMKKTLCLLLALALCLPLLPAAALAEDGTAGEDRQLYFCRSGDEADRLTALRFAPGAYVSGFFCVIPDGETLQRIDSGVVYAPDEGSAENALTLSLAEETENAASSFVWFNTFGTGRLVYTDETGVRYSMAAACALPDRGFSTAATLTEATYLPNDAYCPKDLSFYYVVPEGTVVTGVSAVAAHGDDAMQVPAEVLSEQPNVCCFTLSSGFFSNGAFALEVYFTLQGSDTPATAFISVQDPAPRFGFQYEDFSGHFFPSLNADIRGVFLPRFGLYDQGVFQPVTVTSAVYVPEVDTRSDALAVCQTEDGWQLSALHVGQGTLHCTAADSTVYTLPVDIALPSTGFFSERRMATETYLPRRYDFDADASEHVVWFLTADGFSAEDLANISGWAGESKEDPLDSVERYITVEKVPRAENSERFDIKLTIRSIPGCRLTVWPEHANGTHYVDEELEILNTKKLEGLTPLDAPTDLAWAGDYPGDIRCKPGTLFQDHLLWALYRVGDPTPLARRETIYSRHDPNRWRVDDLLWRSSYIEYPDRESGDYYFTVQAVGDEEQYKDSPVATSPIWHYERPEAALAAPTDLHWEGQTACWSDEVNRAADLYGYLIQFRCKDPETGKAVFTYDYDMYDIESLAFSGLKDTLDDQILERLGSGTCQFRIQALSRDITRIRHGQWSEFNEVGTQLTAPSTVAKALDQLLEKYQPAEGSTTLTDENAERLKQAVAAKKDELERTLFSGADSSNGVAGKLQALEALVGGPASVTVTENAPAAIAQSGVSIVGASLNGAAGRTVTLKIDKAETAGAEASINPAQYHNTIPFSMTLAGVSDEQQHQRLAVPVLITLPLPSSIRPSFLVLLHKTEAGWHEIFPYQILYNDDLRQYCVRFTVTSFSDFAFAQQLFCGIQQLNADNGQLTVCATADVKKVVAAVYDGSGKQLGCAASAIETGGTLTLNLPALKTGAAVRVFFLNETGQPACPAAEQNIRR